MADKNIKIAIQTTADTAGARAAEEALDKVAEAGREAAQAEPQGFGRDTAAARRIAEIEQAEAVEAKADALRKAAEAEQELTAGLGELKEATDAYTESAAEATEQSGQLDDNVSKIARAQKAAAVADLAQKVGLIGGKFKEAAAEIRAFDEEAADKLQATGEHIEKVTGAVSQLALGFAVGGPLGAGVAGIAILVTGLIELFMESEIAAAQAAASQREAMLEVEDAVRNAKAAEDERRAAMAADEIVQGLNDELTALQKISEERRIQSGLAREKRRLENEVLKAEDQAALAGIDEAEAKGEITGPEAETQRAEIEANARKRARETRKAEALEDAKAAEEEAVQKAEIAEKARAAADEVTKQIEQESEKARQTAEYFQREESMMVPGDPSNAKFLDDMTAELESARAILKELETKRLELDRTAKTAEDASTVAARDAAAKQQSAGAVVSAVDRAGAAEERAVESRRGIGQARTAQDRLKEEAGIGQAAARLIPKDAEDALRDSVTKVAKGLQDGDQGGEVKALAELMNRLAAAVEGKGASAELEIKNLSERIKRLEAK